MGVPLETGGGPSLAANGGKPPTDDEARRKWPSFCPFHVITLYPPCWVFSEKECLFFSSGVSCGWQAFTMVLG